MNTWIYCSIRLVLWLVAVAIAAIPAHWTAGEIRLGFFSDLTAINAGHAFRDAVFVVVPAAALALSTIIEFFSLGVNHHGTSLGLAILALIANIAALASGLVGFFLIPGNALTTSGLFAAFSWLILAGLLISLVTEVAMSAVNRNTHTHRNRGSKPDVKKA